MAIPAQYRKVFYLALLVYIITAYFSVGFFHYDEHFQILEFANYKLGYSPASDLPWEFSARIRPALQPSIVYCLAKLLVAANCYDAFLLTLILRLATGIVSWWATCRVVTLLLPEFSTKAGKILFIGTSFFYGSYLIQEYAFQQRISQQYYCC